MAVGWGTLSESGALPTTLQQVTVQTMNYRAAACASVINSVQTQFCAGVTGGGKGKFHSSLFPSYLYLSSF